MDSSTHATAATRERLSVFLTVLSVDPCPYAERYGYRPERLAFELCRCWFDDLYVPSTRYLDGWKGDHSAAAVRQFWACFSEEERAALERFHRFLELRIEMLPEAARRRSVFPLTDAWQHVVRHAGYLLDDLDLDPEHRHRLQAEVAGAVGRCDAPAARLLNGLLAPPGEDRSAG